MTDFVGSEAAATTPGAVLASAREKLGLTIADVAGQMRISPRQVEAIEADRYTELPGAVFVRGFVRNYARVLRLDPVPLLHALEPALDRDAPLRAHEIAGSIPGPGRPGRTVGWLGVLLVLVACVLGAGLYEYLRTKPEAAESRSTVTHPAAEVVAQAREPKSSPEPSLAQVPPNPSGEAQPPTVESSAPVVAAVVEAHPPARESAGTAAAGASRSARIVVEFLRESWIEIRDRSGTVVYSGTGTPASKRSVDAEPPLNVVVGNVAGVRITYNETPVDMTPYAARNIARLTLE